VAELVEITSAMFSFLARLLWL